MKPDYTSLQLPPAPADRPYVVSNMVMSADGKVVVDGTEAGIGSSTDRRLMRELRVNADVVLAGAGTLRANGTSPRLGDPALEELRVLRGKPRLPVAAVVSRSGNLPLERLFFTARDFDAVVYLTDSTPDTALAAVRGTGRAVFRLPGDDTLDAMLRHMRHELRAEVLLVEGGPTLNAELFALGAIDELFLTVGPVVVGGRDTPSAVGGARAFAPEQLKRLELVSAEPNPETSEVYLRYRVQG